MELRLLFILLLPVFLPPIIQGHKLQLSVVAENGLWNDMRENGHEISDSFHQGNPVPSNTADLSKQDNSPVISNRQLRQTGSVNCYELSSEDTLETIMEKCTSLQTKNSYTLQVNQEVDEKKWEDFTSKLNTIKVDIKIDRSEVTKLNLPSLTEFNSKKVTILNNGKLENINITVTNDDIKIEKLSITDNSGLTLVTISADRSTGSIAVENNEMLETLELKMPLITTKSQSGATGLIIANNPNLVNIKILGTSFNFVEGKIQIINNTNLVSLDFSGAAQFIIQEGVVISNNGNLKSIKLPNSTSTVNVPQMEIKQNFKLTSIESVDKFSATALTVRGNPALPKEVLDNMSKSAKSEIQKIGECIFDEPVKNMTVLTACKYIASSLIFVKGTVGSVPSTHILERIEGEVYLADLSITKLDFLKNTVHGKIGKIKTELCDFGDNLGSHRIESPECPTTTTSATSSIGPADGGEVPDPNGAPGPNGTPSPNKDPPDSNGGSGGSINGGASAAPDNATTQQPGSTKTIIITITTIVIVVLLIVGVAIGIVIGYRTMKQLKQKKVEEDRIRKEEDRKRKEEDRKRKENEIKEKERMPEFGTQLRADIQMELENRG